MEVTWSEPITMLKWIILSGNSIFFPLETSIIQSVWSLHLIIILSNKVLKIFDFNSHFHFITGTEVENNWLILISGKSKSWLFLILGKPWQRSRIDNKTEMIIGSCYPNRFINVYLWNLTEQIGGSLRSSSNGQLLLLSPQKRSQVGSYW